MGDPLLWLLAVTVLGLLVAGLVRRRRSDGRRHREPDDVATAPTVAPLQPDAKAEAARRTAESAAAEQAAALQAEEQRVATARAAAEREATERAKALREATERAAARREAARQAKQQRLQAELDAARRAEAERAAAARIEAERAASALAQAGREAAARDEALREAEQQRLRAEREAQLRAQAEREQAQRAQAQRLQAEREAAARVEQERLAAEQAAQRQAAAKSPAQTMVLVADDSKVVRIKTGRLLAQHQYQVSFAGDGIDAAQQLQQGVPDLVITDVEMPGMDGFELTRHIRADPRTAHLPVIMITAADDRHREQADAAGVSVLLGKPYPEDLLIAHIRRALGQDGPVPQTGTSRIPDALDVLA